MFAIDREEAALAETMVRANAPERLQPNICDTLDPLQIEARVSACAERFGRIDVLVNNVGGSACRRGAVPCFG